MRGVPVGSNHLGAVNSHMVLGRIFVVAQWHSHSFNPKVPADREMTAMSTFLTSFAEKLTVYENYETQDAHDKAMGQ